MSRWDSLPLSQQLQLELLNQAATSSSSAPTQPPGYSSSFDHLFNRFSFSPEYAVPQATPDLDHALGLQLGDLIRQELIGSSNQVLCHYQNLTNNIPISLVCELGCCSDGCCGIEEFSQQASIGYGWVLILLIIFITCILISSFVMFVLYVSNKRRDRQLRHQFSQSDAGMMGIGSEGDMINGCGGTSAYSSPTSSQESSRQQIYHIYNGSGTFRPTMISSPYQQQYASSPNHFFRSSF